MNNIQIAKETMKITAEKKYEINGKPIQLPEMDFLSVEVFSPKAGEELLL